MKKLGEFGAALHDAMFEHDAHEQEQPQEPTYPTAAPTTALPDTHYAKTYNGIIPPGIVGIVDPRTNSVYEHFCSITDPVKFEALANFNQMCSKLAKSVPDKTMRMKAALDLSGNTVEVLLNNLSMMRQAIELDVKGTRQKLKESALTTAAEVERLEKLLAVARDGYSKASGAQVAVDNAAARRSADLDQMEKEFKELS